MVDKPRDTPLEKADFPFAKGLQLKAASWVGVGPCVHFPFSVLRPCLTYLGICLWQSGLKSSFCPAQSFLSVTQYSVPLSRLGHYHQ